MQYNTNKYISQTNRAQIVHNIKLFSHEYNTLEKKIYIDISKSQNDCVPIIYCCSVYNMFINVYINKWNKRGYHIDYRKLRCWVWEILFLDIFLRILLDRKLTTIWYMYVCLYIYAQPRLSVIITWDGSKWGEGEKGMK